VMLVPMQQPEQPALPGQGSPEQSNPMASEQMIALGGPGAPAAAQGAGTVAI
jgi:hypothetical protein